ncbi:MAG: UvrD-helicase domain-containing protein [Labilithrix sp.]|nr:UvrD-helicase domain-containing protein [Labilithrix sp.]
MKFVADLHIHSYLSRATSKDLTLEQLHRWAQRKGITVVGTGDFTHPRWFAELREKLVPAEDGLFALREDLARAVDEGVPAACRAPVRFLLSVEVSSIYKRDGKVRKVHNLAYAPDFEAAARIATRLAGIGNIASDGRPILGLDSRDFLEIVLESSPDAYLVPAHIWTPWFSALGAQSGFDAIAACFADLADHVFAVETGLSSDPAMNWRLSALDRYALVSNSDAHSPEKLGREANVFDCDLSYFALRDALRDRREHFLGTVEFFPEEGKYHFDGHRHCRVVLTPAEARDAGGLCPSCGKRLTAGVSGRVEVLADRPEGARPEGAKPFQSLIPLAELLGELVDTGAGSARVGREYERLLTRVGPELAVLGDLPVEELGRDGPPLFGEAIQRMRAGQVQVKPGYDGEYGVVRVFDAEERRQLMAQRSFGFAALTPSAPADRGGPPAGPDEARPERPAREAPSTEPPRAHAPGLDVEQARVVEHPGGPLLVLAGPGTGKTRVVTHRIARLVRGGVSPRAIRAITFTRRAAGELGERLAALLGPSAAAIEAQTFHAFGLALLRDFAAPAGLAPDFAILDEAARAEAIAAAAAEVGVKPSAKLASGVGWAKANLIDPERCAEERPELAPVYAAYQRALEARGALDFDDLVVRAVRLLETCSEARSAAQERRHLFVDEYQDVNPAQERLVLLLAPPGPETEICVVGDPDQAIYGFRGSDPGCVDRFTTHYTGAAVVALRTNYRCPAAVVRAATRVIERAPGRAPRPLEPIAPASPPIERVRLASEAEEARFIAREIERTLGGTSLHSFDVGRGDAASDAELAFHDIAVLFRTSAQADAIGLALDRSGIPYQRVGDDSPTARPDAAELLARLRALVEQSAASDGAARGVGREPVADLLAGLVADEDDADRHAAAELLATLAVPFGRDAAAFLAAVPLWQAGDVGLSAQKVALLTLHAAKGLEFPLVFLAGCEDGLLPLQLPGRSADREEERRLLYVGMTRAKTRLVLTEARQRVVRGALVENGPCPFLDDLPADLVTAPRAPEARPRPAQQLSLL